MTSLAKQMEQLQKQQEVLEQKIKHEEESKKKKVLILNPQKN